MTTVEEQTLYLDRIFASMLKKCPEDLLHIILIRNRLQKDTTIRVNMIVDNEKKHLTAPDYSIAVFNCFENVYLCVEKQKRWTGTVSLAPKQFLLELTHNDIIVLNNPNMDKEDMNEAKDLSQNSNDLYLNGQTNCLIVKISLKTFINHTIKGLSEDMEKMTQFIAPRWKNILTTVNEDVLNSISKEESHHRILTYERLLKSYEKVENKLGKGGS